MVLIPSPDHDPDHRLHVKGTTLHSSLCLPECRALRSNTIEHEMLDAVLQGGLGDPGVTLRPACLIRQAGNPQSRLKASQIVGPLQRIP